jgi:hypothetical protein
MRLSDVPGHVKPIVYVRNPIERFESAYSVVAPGRLPPIDELALDPDGLITDPGLRVMFRDQRWWMYDRPDEYIIDRCIIHSTEHMSWSWPRLMLMFDIPADPLPRLSDPGYNHWSRKPNRKRPRLSDQGRKDVLEWYADDYRLWLSVLDIEDEMV